MIEPSPRPQPVPEPRPLPAVWFIAAAVLFSVMTVMQSLHQGQLAAPATFDDVVYFIDAGRRLIAFYNAGFPALLEGYIQNAPHAPTSTVVSFVGFLLFGFNDWSTAAVNSVWVVALLLVVRRWFAGLPAWVTATVVLAVLAWPILGFLVVEGRPDIVNGFLLAFGCVALVRRPWLTAGRGRLIAVALVFAAALLTKPSVFPITLALYGFSLALATGLDMLDAPKGVSLRHILRRNAAACAITLVVVLPHYLLAVRDVVDYIVTTTFTTEKAIWAVKLPFYDQATFYLWGQGGRQTMAIWVFVTVALVAAAVAIAMIGRQRVALRRVVAMALIFALSFAFVSIPAHKSVYLGVQVSAFCLVFFLLAVRALFTAALAGGSRIGQGVAVLLAIALAATAYSSFQWHWFNRTGQPSVGSPDELARRHALIDAVYAAVKPEGETPSRVYFPAIAYYLNADIVNFAFVRRGDASDDAFDDHRSGDAAAQLDYIRSATHVVLVSPDDPDLVGWLPSAQSLPEVRKAIEADPAFIRVASLEPPLYGGPIEVYARRSALATLLPGDGIRPLEGPYQQWKLPRMRSVIGPEATLKLIDTTPGPATLHLTMQSPVADQVISATIGGRRQGDCTIALAYVNATCDIPVTIQAGDTEIRLSFARQDKSLGQDRSLLLFSQSLVR